MNEKDEAFGFLIKKLLEKDGAFPSIADWQCDEIKEIKFKLDIDDEFRVSRLDCHLEIGHSGEHIHYIDIENDTYIPWRT